jgi:hypothetical protein
MSMSFSDDEDLPLSLLNQDGLVANECYPQMLINDPSFAILNNDPYFLRNARTPDARFASGTIDPSLINGRSPPFPVAKRGLLLNRNDFSVDNTTASRRLTDLEFEVLEKKARIVKKFRDLEEEMIQAEKIECEKEACSSRQNQMQYVTLSPMSSDAT